MRKVDPFTDSLKRIQRKKNHSFAYSPIKQSMNRTDTDRRRLLEATRQLEATGERLQETLTTAQEAVTVGTGSVEILHTQTQQLHGMKNALARIREILENKGQRILRKMRTTRSCTDFLIVAIVLVFLVAVAG